MKKLLIASTAVGLSLVLVGCGSSANNVAINNLSNQLDDTANTISKIQTVNTTSIGVAKDSLAKIANKATSENISNTQASLLNEQNYKSEILSETARIKNCIGKDIKLSKAQTSAIKELTSNLNKYTNSVAYTENELENTVKSIVSMKKKAEKNADKINAKINRLACNSNTRSCYYENILNTLKEIGCYFCDDCSYDFERNYTQNNYQNLSSNNKSSTKSDTNNDTSLSKQNNTNNHSDSTSSDTTSDSNSIKTDKGLTKNIDTYLPKDETKPIRKTKDIRDEDLIDGQFTYNDNQTQQPTIYNRYNRYVNNRNIDTYGPTARNIDTYGGFNGAYYGNYGYGVGNGYYANRYAPAYPRAVAPNGTLPQNGTNTIANKNLVNGYGANYVTNGYNTIYGNRLTSNDYNRLTTPTLEQTTTVSTAEATQSNVDKTKSEGTNTTTKPEQRSEESPTRKPEQRLEDYEVVKEDNTIEKLSTKVQENTSTKADSTVQTMNLKKKADTNKDTDKNTDKTENENTNHKTFNIPNSDSTAKLEKISTQDSENKTQASSKTVNKTTPSSTNDNKTKLSERVEKKTPRIINKDEFKPQTLEYIEKNTEEELNEKIVAHNTENSITCFDINSKLEKMFKSEIS